jgi:4-hydroxymandelate oxidase
VEPINVFDYEVLARERLSPAVWDYYNGGSEDETTLRANRTAFERLRLRPRVLVDVSTIAMHTTLMGTPVSMPILIAPTAAHALAHPEGELATARASSEAGTIMVASTSATRSITEIAQAASGPLWFQLYNQSNRSVTQRLLQEAETCGYRAIVFTVDSPRLGRRERDMRNQFVMDKLVKPANFPDISATKDAQARHTVDTWSTVDQVIAQTSLPVLLKGILTTEDTRLAIEHGITGIIVSNHGGRQLDGVLAGIEALPEVVEAAAGRCEIYVDGGIRRGTDILKALALGARAVLVGRPILWGLATNGQEGVRNVLEMLRAELEMAMSLSGHPTLESIDRSLLK